MVQPIQPGGGGRASISMAHNTGLVAASLAISSVQTLLVPLALGGDGPWGPVLLAGTVLLSPFQWALIHEAIHGLLLPPARANAVLGRALGILFGVPFHLVRFGHLAHHRFNRCAADRPEVYDPAQESWTRAAFRHYGHILGGMYFSSVLAGAAALLPRAAVRRLIRSKLSADDAGAREMQRLAVQQLAGRYLWPIRADAILIVLGMTGTGLAYGPNWPLALAALFGRGAIVSLADNSYHYGTPLSARLYAKNFSLPAWAACVLLHLNLHRVHHAHPQIPWRALPVWDPAASAYDQPYLAGVLQQLRGPVALDRVR